MHQIVLIERISPSCDCWTNLIRKKRISELSIEEIINKYKGFEGELIFMHMVTEKESELNTFIKQCLAIKESENCLLLNVNSSSEIIPCILAKQASLVGYDVGVCEEEKTIYSSIFNEILFGIIDDLIAYKDLLNENLLFPDRSIAKKYVSLHNHLSAQGKDVEDYEEMIIYEIWNIIDLKN
jgi:hypothetical protein